MSDDLQKRVQFLEQRIDDMRQMIIEMRRYQDHTTKRMGDSMADIVKQVRTLKADMISIVETVNECEVTVKQVSDTFESVISQINQAAGDAGMYDLPKIRFKD